MAVFIPVNGKRNSYKEKISYKTLGSVKRLINYILNPNKTKDALMGGIWCNPDTAYNEFILTKMMHDKLPTEAVSKSNQVFHFVQSFDAEELTPELAKQIADEFLQFRIFNGFQIVYAVHIDTEHIHTHFAINSINYENGLRWHISKYDLKEMQDYSDELCKKYNLSVIQRTELKQENYRDSNLNRHISSGEYHAKKNYRSWKAETLHAGLAAKKVAKSQDEFKEIMKSLGYEIRWEETRKDITYINLSGKKINSNKLGFPGKGYAPLTKESLEKQFSLNRQANMNGYATIIMEQQLLKQQLLKLAGNISEGNVDRYPFQKDAFVNSKLEGQALKDKINELEKGRGFEW